MAARPRADRRVSVYSLNVEEGSEFNLDRIEHDRQAPWADYVRGVAAMLQAGGYGVSGFDGVIHSTVPMSSGLSSSAALEVATATLFKDLGGLEIDPVRIARLCQQAENEFVGVNCGILDQYSSAMGQEGCALLLDCRDLSSRPAPIAEWVSVVICDTRAKRELSGSEYAERRAQCEEGARQLSAFYPQVRALRDVTLEQLLAHEEDLPPVVRRRCRFIIQENGRVAALAGALSAGDRDAIGRLAAESYAGARDLYEIVSVEMEAMMGAMLATPGAIGARQAGAGFGGCMVAFVESAQVEAFAQAVVEGYAAATGREARVYPVRAAAGAGVVVG
jgi:galactokinase